MGNNVYHMSEAVSFRLKAFNWPGSDYCRPFGYDHPETSSPRNAVEITRRFTQMKKLMVLALGLGIAFGSVSFAQDKMDDKKMDSSKMEGKKKMKKSKKKMDKMDETKPKM